MKTMTLPIAVAAFTAAFAAEEACKDGMCPLPASPAEAEFAVLSPVPETAVETVKQGPRLRSLEGKTIALVGGSFMASVTHSEGLWGLTPLYEIYRVPPLEEGICQL